MIKQCSFYYVSVYICPASWLSLVNNMKMGVITVAAVLSLATLLAIPINIAPIVADTQPSATVFLDPPVVEGTVIGEKIIVNINVSDVTDFFAWQAGVTFNPNVLKCLGYYEGEFLKRAINRMVEPAEGTLWVGNYRKQRWDNSEGVVYAHGCCILGGVPGVDGSGQLGYLEFEVVGIGVSNLHLTDVVLINSWVEIIPHNVVDMFTVPIGDMDYTVKIVSNLTGVWEPPNPPSSGILNHNFSPEDKAVSFDVVTEHDNFLNVTVPIDLLGSDLKVLIDNIPVSYSQAKTATHISLYLTHGHSTHNIKIKAATTVQSDLNGDGKVNIHDIYIVAAAFGTKPGDVRWDSIADINHDDKVGIQDIYILAKDFGKVF